MPKKKTSSENDISALIGIGAFLLGAALLKPTQDNVNLYKSNEYLFNQFKDNYNEFCQYSNDKNSFQAFQLENQNKVRRWNALGNLQVNQRLNNFPNIANFYNQAIQLYLSGFFRNACISSAITMEALLRQQFNNQRFVDLIKSANNSNIISNSDKSYLDGIRMDRNDYVHTLNQQTEENDAKVVIIITTKIINEIV